MNIISEIPKDLRNYLNLFNCNNLKDLRASLAKRQVWELGYDVSKSHDLDWTKHSLHSYIQLFWSGSLDNVHMYDAELNSLVLASLELFPKRTLMKARDHVIV
ncbi:hypothetical protein CU097_011707, partial [Rhizopus azygosporus]